MSDRRELLRHISEDLKRNTESLVINHIEHDSQTYLAVNKPNCNIVNIIIPYIFGNKVDFAEVCNIEKSLLPDGQKTWVFSKKTTISN